MRVMVMVKATNQSEAGQMPSTELLTAMGNFNEELVKAGLAAATVNRLLARAGDDACRRLLRQSRSQLAQRARGTRRSVARIGEGFRRVRRRDAPQHRPRAHARGTGRAPGLTGRTCVR